MFLIFSALDPTSTPPLVNISSIIIVFLLCKHAMNVSLQLRLEGTSLFLREIHPG